MAVCTLMGKKIKSWKDVQKMLGDKNFIPMILKFDTNKVSEKVRKKINKTYISNEDFTFERINKASKVAEELTATVAELEAKIEEYKAEYQRMVQKITELKNTMAVVEESMSRATKLLTDLSDEKERWGKETENFQKQLSTLDGDCLLAAGFLTYIGFYNQTYRGILIGKWKELLIESKL